MYRLNLAAVIMLFGCALLAFVLMAAGVSQRWAGTAALLLMVALDLAYRLRSRATGRNKWLGSEAGGFLAFVPVWVMGLVLAGLLQMGLLD